MTHCLCGHPDTDHAIGEGICNCGCPAYRPTSIEYTAAMAANDAQHDGVAEEFLALHRLSPEVSEDGTTAHLWTLLPEPEDLT